MRYAVLGPLEISNGLGPLAIGGRKERTLLAALLAAPGGWVSADAATQLLWEVPPPSATRTLRAYVARLRTALEPTRGGGASQVLRTVPGGWQLHVLDDEVDSRRFERRGEQARTALRRGRYVEAARAGDEALAEWRSAAFGEFEHVDVCAAEAARLTELRAAVEEDVVDAVLALGGAAELIARLERTVREWPLRERPWGQLMTALYRSGRAGDSLAAYQRVRAALRDELGVDPGQPLRALHAAVLRQEPFLSAPSALGNTVRRQPRNPFKGLMPYTAQDAGLLVGRERQLARVIARLGTETALCLVGASGSGKSSLVQAGLLPALRRGALPGSGGWRLSTVTPGDAARERLPLPREADLIVVDQLEELVTSAREPARRAFARRLAELAEHGVRLVLVVRSDLWADCAAMPGLGELLTASPVLVGPLSEDELRLVVREGARRGGIDSVEDDLVEAVVDDARGQDGALPLVSTALARTWDRRENGRLTQAGYRAAGGVAGAVGESAEEAWAALSEPEQAAARRILLRLAGNGPAGPTRRRAAFAELVPDDDAPAGQALNVLVAARLVVTAEDGVTVSHETLFTAWPRLADWLAEDAAGRRVRARLTPAALDWARQGRPESDLLRGPRLVEALDWAQDEPERLIPAEHDFLTASARARDERAVRERRTTRRLRRLVAGIAVLLVAALLSTALALRASRQASAQATTATARRLAEQALLETRPDLALLLATQAVRLHADPDTRGDLLATLLRTSRALQITHLPNRPEFLALSADGRSLAVSDNQGSIQLVDPATLAPARRLVAGSGLPVFGLAFAAGGRELAAAEQLHPAGARMTLRDVATGRLLAAAPVPDGWALSAAPDGGRVAVSSYSGSWLWTPGGRSVRLSADFGLTNITRNGRLAAVVGPNGTALYNVRSGRVLRSLPQVRGLAVAALSPDGRRLATTERGGGVTVWDAAAGEPLARLSGHAAEVNSLAFGAPGRLLASGDDAGSVLVWDVATGRLVQRLSVGSGPVSVALAPDERTVYTVDQDGTLAAWDLTGTRGFGTTVDVPPQSDLPEDAAAFSGDGRRLVLAVRGQLVVCAGPSLRVERTVPLPAPGLAVAADPVGRRAVVLTAATLLLIDLDRGLVRQQTPLPTVAPDGTHGTVAWSPDGSRIAVSDPATRQLLLLDPRSLAGQRRLLPQQPGQVVYAPDGRAVAVAMSAGRVAVLDTGDTHLRVLPVGVDPVAAPALAFVDNRRLAVGGRDGRVRLWDLRTGRAASDPIPAVPGEVDALSAEARTGTVVVTGGDGSVRLVDPIARSVIGTQTGIPTNSNALALVDPARPRLLELPAGKSPAAWDLDPRDWRQRACRLTGRTLNHEEWRRYLGDRPYAPACGSFH